MAFRLIGDKARAQLALPEETSGGERSDIIVAALRADYERWSRWLLGLVAYITAVVARRGE